MNSEFHTRVLLSTQRALLGEITPEMRAVEVVADNDRILLRVFTEGDVTNSLKEDFDASAVTQVLADFTDLEPVPHVDFEFVRCDAPGRIPVRGQLVFAQAGVTVDAVERAP